MLKLSLDKYMRISLKPVLGASPAQILPQVGHIWPRQDLCSKVFVWADIQLRMKLELGCCLD